MQVGNHWLDPGEAVYDQTVLYATHNVTSLLTAGTTSVMARIGNSKYVTLRSIVWSMLLIITTHHSVFHGWHNGIIQSITQSLAHTRTHTHTHTHTHMIKHMYIDMTVLAHV